MLVGLVLSHIVISSTCKQKLGNVDLQNLEAAPCIPFPTDHHARMHCSHQVDEHSIFWIEQW
jgi:hypothetical protein